MKINKNLLIRSFLKKIHNGLVFQGNLVQFSMHDECM